MHKDNLEKLNAKKIKFSLLLILLTLGFAAAIGIASLTGGDINAIQGASDIHYPVYLSNNESIAGFQMTINYSTKYLILKEIEGTERLPSATIVQNSIPPILKIAVLVNNETNQIQAGEGAILNLIFDINESAMPEDYAVSFSDVIISNIETTNLQTSIYDGNFRISEPYNLTFLPPISNFENFTLQEGATLPLKFNLFDAEDFVYDDSVQIRIYNFSLGIDHTYNASGIGDDYIRINETEEQYTVNIHTGEMEMPEGIYNIYVTFDNHQSEHIGFELLDKSNGVGKGKEI